MGGAGSRKPPGEGAFASIGISLVILRTMRRLTQDELASRAGIRPNQVSRYETGQVLPQLRQLGRLLDALEIDVTDFFLFLSAVSTWRRVLCLGDGMAGRDAREVQNLVRELTARQSRLQEALLDGVEAFCASRGESAGGGRDV